MAPREQAAPDFKQVPVIRKQMNISKVISFNTIDFYDNFRLPHHRRDKYVARGDVCHAMIAGYSDILCEFTLRRLLAL